MFAVLAILFGTPLFASKYEVAATMIFRDEAPYLKEWIEFHALLGVEHFYLYDHLSQDNFREVLQPYIEVGLVDLESCRISVGSLNEWDRLQNWLISLGIERARREAKWLLILDSDEFFLPVKCGTIPAYLSQFEGTKVGSVEGLICLFSTGGVERIPDDQLLVETLVRAVGGNGLRKSAVRLDRCVGVGNPHNMNLAKGYVVARPSWGELQINHYWARDRYYLYNFKIPRRAEWGTPADTCVRWAEGGTYCPDQAVPMERFIAPLRKRMGLE